MVWSEGGEGKKKNSRKGRGGGRVFFFLPSSHSSSSSLSPLSLFPLGCAVSLQTLVSLVEEYLKDTPRGEEREREKGLFFLPPLPLPVAGTFDIILPDAESQTEL